MTKITLEYKAQWGHEEGLAGSCRTLGMPPLYPACLYSRSILPAHAVRSEEGPYMHHSIASSAFLSDLVLMT